MPDRTVPSHDTQVIKVDQLTVRVAESGAKLTEDAAHLVLDYLKTLLAQQETVSIVLATGNSQLQFLEAIAQDNQIDWSRIILFHLDEYLGLASDHPSSFNYYLRTKVEQKVKPRKFNYLTGDAPEPISECRRYGKLLQQQAIDLCLLGIGDNGHLAFNEPKVANFADPEIVKLVQLAYQTRLQQVNGGSFDRLDLVPAYAYTLTLSTISQAKKIVCLAGGAKKALVVQQTLAGTIAPDFPATFLRKLSQAVLICDRSAISKYLT